MRSHFARIVVTLFLLSQCLFLISEARGADLTVTTFAGIGGAGSNDGSATEAKFNFPKDVKVDKDGVAYLLDKNSIRKVTTSGTVTTIYRFPGAPMNTSYCSINIDKKEIIWVVECNAGNVLRLTKTGQLLNTLSVTSSNGWIGYPHTTGFLPDGRILIPVWFAGKIMAVSETGAVSTYFNNNPEVSCGGMAATRSSSSVCPYSLAVSDTGKVLIANGNGANTIQQLDGSGRATPISSPLMANALRFVNGNFYATTLYGQGDSRKVTLSKIDSNLNVSEVTSITVPWRWINSGFDIDASGNFYQAMHWDHTLNVYKPNGQLQLKVGAASLGSNDGARTQSTFFNPSAIVEDSERNLYIKQQGAIRKIATNGQVTTIYKSNLIEELSGLAIYNDRLYFTENSGYFASVDIQGNNYRSQGIVTLSPEYFNYGANSLTVDSKGNFYFVVIKTSDGSSRVIRKISQSGSREDLTNISFSQNTSTSIYVDYQDTLWVLHNGTIRTFDTNGNTVTTNLPTTYFGSDPSIQVSSNGSVYILSTDFRSVILNQTKGTTQTLLITGSAGESQNAGQSSSFNAPKGMLLSRSGDLYIADTDNNVIRKVELASTSASTTSKTRTARSVNEVPRPSELTLGVYQTAFNSYFDDKFEVFSGGANTQSIVDSLPIWDDGLRANKSYQWTGYFIPDYSGQWTFRLTSDDAAYLWIGGDAISKFRNDPVNTAVVSAPGQHVAQTKIGTINLVKDKIYPFRAIYGNWENTQAIFKLEFKAPGFSEFESNYRSLLWKTIAGWCTDYGIDYVLVGDLGYEKNTLNPNCLKNYATGSSIGTSTPNQSMKTKPNTPTFSAVNFIGNKINIVVNLGNASSRPQKVYLVAPKLGISASNPLSGKVSGNVATWAIDFDKVLGGTMIPLEIVGEKDGQKSDALTGSYQAPAVNIANTKVPAAPKNFKQRIVGTSAVITVEATVKAGAIATNAFLFSKGLSVSKTDALEGEVVGAKVVFEVPIKTAMAGKKIPVTIYLANDVGDSTPLNATLTIPSAPKVPKIPTTVPKPGTTNTVLCSRASQTRAFAGTKCPPGWEVRK